MDGLIRDGQVKIGWQGETPLVKLIGSNHCGTLTENRFHYDVTLYGFKLNERGFLTDNKHIAEWFDKLHETDWSCELIAKHAARDFVNLEPNVTRAQVKIWGIRDQAYAEAEACREECPV